DRLIYQARLQARYGRSWRRKAPVEALMPLRLARIGVPLAQTAPEGLSAAGIDPALLSPRTVPAALAPAAAPALPVAVPSPDEDTATEQGPDPSVDIAGGEVSAGASRWAPAAAPVDLYGASRDFIGQFGRFPTAEQLAAFIAQRYGVTDPETGGLLADELLEPVLADLREAGLDPVGAPADDLAGNPADVTPEPDDMPVAAANGTPAPARQPHPFFGEPRAGAGHAAELARPASATWAPVPAPTASAKADVPMHSTSERHRSADTSVPAPAGEAQPWTAEVTDTGEATARVPQQQTDEPDVDPIQQEIELVAQWLTEAQDAGKKLSGAETARRLGVSPKTGQRRVIEAAKLLEERRRRQGRAHLRSVRG
ncbi:hypothetical protein AB0O21_34210, partial [Streptomyces sp. NPDC091371]